MKIKLVVFFLYIMIGISGCTTSATPIEEAESIGVDVQYQIKKMPYSIYLQKEIELSPYEPSAGTYLGAYVLSNPEIDFDIKKFEEIVGKEMAITMRHYQLGEDVPEDWLLECLSQAKTPYVVITPQDFKKPYDKELLEETARKFENTYGMPMFVEFYANPKDFEDPSAYISYFQLAKEIFSHYAPNTIFVWSINMDDMYDSMIYYPGDEYVDWIGLHMYFPIYKEDERYLVDIDEKLNYFYDMYQERKPLMISKLAVSHYSKKGHTFYIEEANDIINYIYDVVPKEYPRIRAINYIDLDNIKIAPNGLGSDNFLVSTEPKVTKNYKEAISNPHYLERVEESEDVSSIYWAKLKSPIYEWNNKLYITEDMMMYDLGIDDRAKIERYAEIIGSEKYYKLDDVVKVMNAKYMLKGNNLRIFY